MNAEIIADSINSNGCRLTTYILEYQRYIHSEILTHRMFSKNAASSRAIPVEKMIQSVIDNPAMPVWWGKNQSGMQAKEELDNVVRKHIYNVTDLCQTECTDMEAAKYQWLEARDNAIKSVREMMKIGLHKQIANRILEPWFNIRIILSGTEFENFFALRCHPDAQPELQALAYKMLDAYNASSPKQLREGEWHIPFGDNLDDQKIFRLAQKLAAEAAAPGHSMILGYNTDIPKIKVAIARCARISYLNFEGKDDYEADIKLCDKLFQGTPKHLSPTEHVAQATADDKFIGNFRGFKQFRYTFSDQNLTDPRVLKK